MNRIQELRKEANMTQNDLAKIIGVNPVTLSRYENGERNPKLDKLEKIAETFHVSVDYLTGKPDVVNSDVIRITREEYLRLKEVEKQLNSIKQIINKMNI